ncbi:hypothetical protein [Pseudomonas schmalbachii]|uniref:General secretion pathway protein GspK n=1 Tax=Pseudomonas schmalbachii TaxID=2816993 RepID=A0ABS3TLQ4_9PSED|nr:hypothetical protein [Pseudomonas schmalbachii]MBO3274595.1 hypothetical protein [Pseudomonas schmalbachii]
MIAERGAGAGAERGFVLVGVIWFLACMTMVVAAAVLWIERSRDGVEAQRELLQSSFEERSMLSRLIWLIATHRMTVAGQTTPESIAPEDGGMDPSILPAGAELPVDGREYCVANGSCFTLIDRASRLSLSASDPAAIQSLLVGMGVPVESVSPMLVELAVYLRGGQYESVGQPRIPSLRALRSPMEVFLLSTWQPWEDLLVRRGWCEVATVDEPALNLNSAAADVLVFAWGIPADSVASLLAIRGEHPIVQSRDLDMLLGAHADGLPQEGWSRLPSSTLLIRLRPRDGPARYEYQVSFESSDLRLPPWQFLQRRTLPSHVSDTALPQEVHATPGILAAPLVAGPWR